MQKLVTEAGEEHGLINTVANSVADTDFKHIAPENKEKFKKMRAEDAKVKKAKYINMKGENERLERPYMRWAGDPIHTFKLIPGHIYELPMGFINEINSKQNYQRSEVLDANSRPTIKDKLLPNEHQLVPVGF
jgi:hypothetical protein